MPARRKPSRSPASYTEPLPNGSPLADGPSGSSTNLAQPSPRRHSPFLPTPLETLLLAIYPTTLLLGSAFSLLSPLTRNTPYSGDLQSHPDALAPSYFARKRNVFNVYFVKRGWFWTTLALFVFLFTHPSLGPVGRPVLTPRRVRAALRHLLATLFWGALTQWFFGPPLIDTTFRLTGGQCALLRDPGARAEMSDGRELLTAAACRLAGGQWRGGHDISGHVFLLILGSALLWMEILPVVLRAEGLREERLVRMADGKVRNAAAEAEVERHGGSEAEGKGAGIGLRVVLGVVGLSHWMLLMTAAFFHTWLEKFTGLLVAFLALWVVYFLPRGVPALRAVVGMPGV